MQRKLFRILATVLAVLLIAFFITAIISLNQIKQELLAEIYSTLLVINTLLFASIILLVVSALFLFFTWKSFSNRKSKGIVWFVVFIFLTAISLVGSYLAIEKIHTIHQKLQELNIKRRLEKLKEEISSNEYKNQTIKLY